MSSDYTRTENGIDARDQMPMLALRQSAMTSAQIVPALVVPFVAWRVYLRVRRNIGRQPFRASQLKFRTGFFAAITVLFGLTAWRHLPSLGALAGGLALAVPIALVGLNLTRFETAPDGKRSYVPNTAIGIALSVLFVGRLGYRLVVLFVAPPMHGPEPAGLFQSPLTYFVFGLTAGYYIAYYAGILLRAPHRFEAPRAA
jgi:hypothetical protein